MRREPGARVRPARRRDLDRLSALFSLLVAQHAAWHPRFQLGRGGEALLAEELAGWLGDADTGIWLAESGEPPQIQGLCVARLARRSAGFQERLRGAVEHLYVRESGRRQGAGRALVEVALGWLGSSGARRVEIQVARPNRPGRAFWDALGFRPTMDVLERPL